MKVYGEDCEGWWLPGGRSLVVAAQWSEDWQLSGQRTGSSSKGP